MQSCCLWRTPVKQAMINKYQDLKRVIMEDTDKKKQLLGYIILEANDYAKIKTSKLQQTVGMGEPVAKYTHFR